MGCAIPKGVLRDGWEVRPSLGMQARAEGLHGDGQSLARRLAQCLCHSVI